MNQSLNNKISGDQFDDNIKSMKTEFNQKSEQMVKKNSENLENTKLSMLKKQGELDRKMKDLEKKTIWKLDETEALLNSRASKQYVDDADKDLENKIMRLVSISISLRPKID